MATQAIVTENLKKSFFVKDKKGKKKIDAVDGVSLAVECGEIFGFLGPNGAGKTTTLRMITTLLPIDGGRAEILGIDVGKNPKEVRRHIGYVGQAGGADIGATVIENLKLSGRLYGMPRADIESRACELLKYFDLAGMESRIVRKLSGGQKRRLEVALGILHKPELLFLDEPTTGLDPQNRANLWAQIRELNANGTTVFITTHYMDEADKLCGRIAIIDGGKIAAIGTPPDLKREIAGDVVTVKTEENLENVKNVLRGLSGIKDVRGEGDTLYLYIDDGAKKIPEIMTLLERQNITVGGVTLSRPSLDDVFLKQTGRVLRD